MDMTAAELITQATADGVTLAAVAGRIKATGPSAAVARWAPQLRQFRAELVEAMRAPQLLPSLPVPASHAVEIVMASSPEVDVPRHCWWVHDERGTFSIDFGPRVTLAQVRELYPNAKILEDEVDEEVGT